MDARTLRGIVGVIGFVFLVLGALAWLTPVHRDGTDCGTVLHSNQTGDPSCDSALSDRLPITIGLFVIGGACALGCSWIGYGSEPDDRDHDDPS